MKNKKNIGNGYNEDAESTQLLSLEEIGEVAGGETAEDRELLRCNAKTYAGDLSAAARSEAIRKVLGNKK